MKKGSCLSTANLPGWKRVQVAAEWLFRCSQERRRRRRLHRFGLDETHVLGLDRLVCVAREGTGLLFRWRLLRFELTQRMSNGFGFGG